MTIRMFGGLRVVASDSIPPNVAGFVRPARVETWIGVYGERRYQVARTAKLLGAITNLDLPSPSTEEREP